MVFLLTLGELQLDVSAQWFETNTPKLMRMVKAMRATEAGEKVWKEIEPQLRGWEDSGRLVNIRAQMANSEGWSWE